MDFIQNAAIAFLVFSHFSRKRLIKGIVKDFTTGGDTEK